MFRAGCGIRLYLFLIIAFLSTLHDDCGLEDVVFDDVSIIFCNQKFDNLLNVLLGKRFIFHMKMEKKMPTLKRFLYLVKLNSKFDKYNAVENKTQPACEKVGQL